MTGRSAAGAKVATKVKKKAIQDSCARGGAGKHRAEVRDCYADGNRVQTAGSVTEATTGRRRA